MGAHASLNFNKGGGHNFVYIDVYTTKRLNTYVPCTYSNQSSQQYILHVSHVHLGLACTSSHHCQELWRPLRLHSFLYLLFVCL